MTHRYRDLWNYSTFDMDQLGEVEISDQIFIIPSSLINP